VIFIGYMKLNENILRVKEIMGINESADAGENDISFAIDAVLNTTFVEPNKDIVCKVKVIHPKNIEVLMGQQKYVQYKLVITFIGGYGTKYWPRTMAVNDMYEKLMDEAWFLVYNFVGKSTAVFSEYVKECDSTEKEVERVHRGILNI